MAKKKVWIDTDIGDDVDDAFALVLAVRSPEIELLGVSTVYGNTEKRAALAKRLLRLAGAGDIPVYCGESLPLRTRSRYGDPVDYAALPPCFFPEFDTDAADGGDGVRRLAEALDRDPGLTVVAIGPLTNLARLYADYPSSAAKIGELIVMGGAYEKNVPEYNFAGDPDAADYVLSQPTPKFLVGLDVTFRCGLKPADMRRMKSSGDAAVRMLMTMVDRRCLGTVFFHDPLAVMCSFDRSYVLFRPIGCRVETEGKWVSGQVVDFVSFLFEYAPQSDGANCYAASVASEEFLRDCVGRILGDRLRT